MAVAAEGCGGGAGEAEGRVEEGEAEGRERHCGSVRVVQVVRCGVRYCGGWGGVELFLFVRDAGAKLLGSPRHGISLGHSLEVKWLPRLG